MSRRKKLKSFLWDYQIVWFGVVVTGLLLKWGRVISFSFRGLELSVFDCQS